MKQEDCKMDMDVMFWSLDVDIGVKRGKMRILTSASSHMGLDAIIKSDGKEYMIPVGNVQPYDERVFSIFSALWNAHQDAAQAFENYAKLIKIFYANES